MHIRRVYSAQENESRVGFHPFIHLPPPYLQRPAMPGGKWDWRGGGCTENGISGVGSCSGMGLSGCVWMQLPWVPTPELHKTPTRAEFQGVRSLLRLCESNLIPQKYIKITSNKVYSRLFHVEGRRGR